ncbi:TonB-dependent receptor [Marinimicrobium sp. ABcell2]|uniref:TonB-dependent receptor n=1 Tax=Marinimicrobium sp. ABcell2 TaxID=3069751 RepID=UPI0027B6BA45|nr:TonB-dependent receptor [Marinimicrobium sp. ABcell2]MDQ2075822.1 TonB-dependent receptor [Marinimicrobium sp. ABcell2]
MQNKPNLKKKVLPAVIAAFSLSGISTAVHAQELEEIVVTGIRASLERSMDIKRESAGVVDAITAEDMGKFPDANLAESLQRITGVSVDRVNGEGSQVTVRGFGAADNMVTLNGRTMPAGYTYGGGSGAGGTSGGATRAFDFSNLASESVSGVEVYKTGRASVPTGGIGASINIKTLRPLESPSNQAAISVKAMHDTTNREGSDVTPEVSGLLSWANDSATFGVSLTASHSERDSSIAGAHANNWNIARWDADAHAQGQDANMYSWTRDGDGDISAIIENPPNDGQLFARPNDFRWSYSDRHRERTNAQLTAQFAPADNVTLTADYTFAEVYTREHRGEWTLWFANDSTAEHVVFDNSPVATPVFYSERLTGKDMGYEQQLREQTNTLQSIGFNVDWQVNDSLTLNFDVHDSSMENLPTGPGDSGEIAISMGAPIGTRQWVDFSGDLPVGNYEWADDGTRGTRGNANGLFDPGDFGTQQGRVFYAAQLMDITQFRMDGTQEFDRSQINFGLEHRAMEMTQQSSTRQVSLGTWGVNNPGEISDYITNFNMADPFTDFDMSGSFQDGMRAIDVLALCERTVELYPSGQEQEWRCAADKNFTSDNRVDEDITAVYVEYAHNFDLGGMESNILLGLRHEETNVTSTTQMRIPSYRPWQDSNDFQITIYETDDVMPYSVETSYSNTLPSLDFDIRLREDLVGRASVSQTISRANYGSLYANVGNFWQGDPTYLGAVPTASRGNPALEPLESTNLDLSLEWYFGDASYASVGLFNKDVKNFIGTAQAYETHFGLRDPSNGPRVHAAAEALEDMGVVVNNRSLFVMTAILSNPEDFPGGAGDFQVDPDNSNLVDYNFAVQVATDYNIVPTDEDPLVDWFTSLPNNQRKASIRGAEFAVQHFFGDTGFGIQANYTIVDGDVGFDDLADPSESQFALLGLSDTANVVFMYENYGVQARLAYNWRDKFLRETNQGSSRNPIYVDAYQQWDLSVSYDVNDNLSVFFEGLNLTEENVRWHTRSDRMTQYLEQLGARYQLGFRYSF